MGRFVHEAVAVDPETGYVYETEDRGRAGFYRFIPKHYGQLHFGGKLQMLKVPGRQDLGAGAPTNFTCDVEWVDIDDPYRAHADSHRKADGVLTQGACQGAAIFKRLEGCWYRDNLVYFSSTDGGAARKGQVWAYHTRSNQLRLIFESPGAHVLDAPDNLTVSPRGGILLCEDGSSTVQRLHGLTTHGRIFPFAENNVILDGERNGIAGDFRDQEWAGATFCQQGKWLFVNIQTPGITFAITGPWRSGAL
jgi:secreted PhoX family phosphatase